VTACRLQDQGHPCACGMLDPACEHRVDDAGEWETHYEFEIIQNDDIVAGGEGGDLERVNAEAAHYALQYAQDGPVTVTMYEVRTRRIRPFAGEPS